VRTGAGSRRRLQECLSDALGRARARAYGSGGGWPDAASPEYRSFLAMLGETITLKGWGGYRAGLNVTGTPAAGPATAARRARDLTPGRP